MCVDFFGGDKNVVTMQGVIVRKQETRRKTDCTVESIPLSQPSLPAEEYRGEKVKAVVIRIST